MKKAVKTALIGLTAVYSYSMAADNEQIKTFFRYEVIPAKKVTSEISSNPDSPIWEKVPGQRVYLYPQLTVRLNDKKANELLSKKRKELAWVKAIYNDDKIAVFVQWKDNTYSVQSKYDTDSFGDGVSIEFPNKFGKGITLPYVGMGDTNHPVTVYLQKAVEGRDYEKVFVSEGFGSLTEIKEDGVSINMKYDKNLHLWKAVFVRPLKTENSNLKAGLVPIAFAIWDGKELERDGNKALSRWKFIRLKDYALDEDYLNYVSWGFPSSKLGDVKNGKALFKQYCAGCHVAGDVKMAIPGMYPDLSAIGGYGNPIYIKESIVNPNDVVIRNLNPNRHYNKNMQPDKFRAYPNDLSYAWYRVENGKYVSNMPNLGLQEKDVRDIVAYLRSLWKNF